MNIPVDPLLVEIADKIVYELHREKIQGALTSAEAVAASPRSLTLLLDVVPTNARKFSRRFEIVVREVDLP